MKKKNDPKVLVISHNPFSEKQNNGKTLSMFFRGWNKSSLAQFFITPQKIDDTICNNYYFISDIDIVKSIRKNKVGNIISAEKLNNINKISSKNNPIISLFLKFPTFYKIIREIIWRVSKNKVKKSLKEWLDIYKPEVIFYQTSNCIFMYKIVSFISNTYNIPIIMETTDDYVTPKKSINFLKFIHTKKLEKYYSEMVKKSYCVFAIGSAMADEYKKRFGGNFKIAINSIDNKDEPKTKINNTKDLLFVYTGNISLNRWKVLNIIGEALKKINLEFNIKSRLDIYSLEIPSKNILKKLNIENSTNFKGSISQSKIINIRNQADILVHVEAFDKKNIDITRLSISTKIPEYLLSKRSILAVGPKDVASIKYLEDNNLAFVVNNMSFAEIFETLKNIIINKKQREILSINSYKFALKNHNPKILNKEIRKSIYDAVGREDNL